MDRKTKQENLNFLIDKLSNIKSVVFTNFKGLSAQEMSSMRRLIREEGGDYKVVKNTIALMAIEKSGNEEAKQFISGSCGIAFSPMESIGLVKILVNFSKENESLVLKGGIIEGEIVDNERLKRLAALPGKNELLTNILVDLRGPISNLINYLYQMTLGLVCVINLVKSKQEEGGKNAKEGTQ
jgi:large subunit ribosomal protein L10